MPSKKLDYNPLTVAIREIFAPLVKQTQKLPAPLAYGFAVVLVILMVILLGKIIPTDIVILIGVIVVLALVFFSLADWDARRQSSLQPKLERQDLSKATLSKLPKPGSSPGTLVLLSAQSRDAGKNEVLRRIVKARGDSEAESPPWTFHQIQTLTDLDNDELSSWRGIFLAMPYNQTISPTLNTRLVKWVHDGGNLIVTGFELGERHHRTNINQFIYHFGLSFNSDVVVRPKSEFSSGERSKDPKDYDTTLLYEGIFDQAHPLFRGIHAVAMRNACSLHLEPGALPLLLVHPNQIRELSMISARYSEEGGFSVLASGAQLFQEPYEDPKRVIAALAPKDLTGRGKVLALGTWDFQSDGRRSDNEQFVVNLWYWLVS